MKTLSKFLTAATLLAVAIPVYASATTGRHRPVHKRLSPPTTAPAIWTATAPMAAAGKHHKKHKKPAPVPPSF